MVYDANFHELEYFVPLEKAPDALQALRELMLRSLPQSVYPMEVRTVGPDDAYLSPNYRTATTAISVSGNRAPTIGITCVRWMRCSTSSTHASIGASSTS